MSPLGKTSNEISTVPDMPQAIPAAGPRRHIVASSEALEERFEATWMSGSQRMLYRWYIRRGPKGGSIVGKTKPSKGTKIMAIADGAGLPVSICIESASPHEVKLFENTVDNRFVSSKPKRLFGDMACDRDQLAAAMEKHGIEMIAPHRSNRTKPLTQDGCPLQRYKRRWIVERLITCHKIFRSC